MESVHIVISQNSCIPKQIPSTGWFNFGITLSRPHFIIFFIALFAAPCPGNMTLSAEFILSTSEVKIFFAPKRSRAN